jgi:hypothetical protein
MRIEARTATLRLDRNLIVGLGGVIAALMLIAPAGAAAQPSPTAQAMPAVQATPAAAPAKQATPAAHARTAAHAKKPAKERVISVNIAKGQLYIIEDVAKGAGPGIKVVDNPNALLVHTEKPGQLVLLGSDTGTWKLNVTLASGEKVIYEVNVTAIAPAQGSLEPATAPTVMP